MKNQCTQKHILSTQNLPESDQYLPHLERQKQMLLGHSLHDGLLYTRFLSFSCSILFQLY